MRNLFGIPLPERKGMKKGGSAIPRNTVIANQPHHLAYINKEEDKMLRDAGGSGQPGPGGVPAFPPKRQSGAGANVSGSVNSGFKDFTQGSGGGNDDNDDDNNDDAMTEVMKNLDNDFINNAASNYANMTDEQKGTGSQQTYTIDGNEFDPNFTLSQDYDLASDYGDQQQQSFRDFIINNPLIEDVLRSIDGGILDAQSLFGMRGRGIEADYSSLNKLITAFENSNNGINPTASTLEGLAAELQNLSSSIDAVPGYQSYAGAFTLAEGDQKEGDNLLNVSTNPDGGNLEGSTQIEGMPLDNSNVWVNPDTGDTVTSGVTSGGGLVSGGADEENSGNPLGAIGWVNDGIDKGYANALDDGLVSAETDPANSDKNGLLNKIANTGGWFGTAGKLFGQLLQNLGGTSPSDKLVTSIDGKQVFQKEGGGFYTINALGLPYDINGGGDGKTEIPTTIEMTQESIDAGLAATGGGGINNGESNDEVTLDTVGTGDTDDVDAVVCPEGQVYDSETEMCVIDPFQQGFDDAGYDGTDEAQALLAPTNVYSEAAVIDPANAFSALQPGTRDTNPAFVVPTMDTTPITIPDQTPQGLAALQRDQFFNRGAGFFGRGRG